MEKLNRESDKKQVQDNLEDMLESELVCSICSELFIKVCVHYMGSCASPVRAIPLKNGGGLSFLCTPTIRIHQCSPIIHVGLHM